MTGIERFVLYNLLPSLLAGVLVWGAAWAVIRLLRIEQAQLRLCLLAAPAIKSTLVLLGLGLVLPWPREPFTDWAAGALPATRVLPLLALWAGVVWGAGTLLSRRARRLVLGDCAPADEASPRLVRALDRVMNAYDAARPWDPACPWSAPTRRPALRVTSRELPSPCVLTSGGEPLIVFPAKLERRLSDAELEGALAHEVAHVQLRRPLWCQGLALSRVGAVLPAAPILAGQVRREEEKACDEAAVAALGRPEVYAEMLLKSYRFARERSGAVVARLRIVPQLLGLRPSLSERVERLLRSPSPARQTRLQVPATWAAWVALYFVFFRSG